MSDNDSRPLVVLLSHGGMARGIKRSAEMICGPSGHLVALDLRPQDSPDSLFGRLQRQIQGKGAGREVLVLVDLFGGTPSNVGARFLGREGIECVAGLNLPMLLAVLTEEAASVRELAAVAVQAGREGVVNLRKRLDGMGEGT